MFQRARLCKPLSSVPSQALRPDRLESGMELYVRSVLGLASTSPEPFSLGKLHQEETTAQGAQTPIESYTVTLLFCRGFALWTE